MPLTKGIIIKRLFEGHRKTPHVSLMDMLIADYIALHENWTNAERALESEQSGNKIMKTAIKQHRAALWGPRVVQCKEDAYLYKVIK